MRIAHIIGGERLDGDVRVGGSKNACLPVLAASLLTDEECVIHNVPRLNDIAIMLEIFSSLGVKVSRIGKHSVKIHAKNVSAEAPASLVGKMRGSVCLMGALIGRIGKAMVHVPGGCVIGTRPIDLHLKGFRALGCFIAEKDDLMMIDGSNVHGAQIYLRGARGSTMTGTMNVIMAALRAHGETIIEGAAVEPEVVDFCNYLVAMGARIYGIGTSVLKIFGGIPLHGCEYTIIGDRIEAGTFVCAGLMTGGNVNIFGLECHLLDPFLEKLMEIGAVVFQDAVGTIRVRSNGQLSGTDIDTGPHPGFPTDLQAQFCSLLTQSTRRSCITENIYPDRFLYTRELGKMGASISVELQHANVDGNSELIGTHVVATDLRASAALYLAGLRARGDTFVHDIHHLIRGYENFDEKLCSLGARIEQIEM
jgi:UDP-N-acetylglucosamine 1-carboxyvinyltransferase